MHSVFQIRWKISIAQFLIIIVQLVWVTWIYIHIFSQMYWFLLQMEKCWANRTKINRKVDHQCDEHEEKMWRVTMTDCHWHAIDFNHGRNRVREINYIIYKINSNNFQIAWKRLWYIVSVSALKKMSDPDNHFEDEVCEFVFVFVLFACIFFYYVKHF